MGMFGTCSMVITAAARSAASRCLSAKVPVVAYTSIMGMAMLLRQIGLWRAEDPEVWMSPARRFLRRRGQGLGRRLDELRHLVGVGDHRDVVGGDLDGGRAHAAGELVLGVWWDRFVLRGDQVLGRQRPPGWDVYHVRERGAGQGLLHSIQHPNPNQV